MFRITITLLKLYIMQVSWHPLLMFRKTCVYLQHLEINLNLVDAVCNIPQFFQIFNETRMTALRNLGQDYDRS